MLMPSDSVTAAGSQCTDQVRDPDAMGWCEGFAVNARCNPKKKARYLERLDSGPPQS